MTYRIVYTNQYKRAIKKIYKQDTTVLSDVKKVVDLLALDETLPKKYKDHKLSGKLKSFRELHVRPDLLLVYQKDSDILVLLLVNIGSHSDLF